MGVKRDLHKRQSWASHAGLWLAVYWDCCCCEDVDELCGKGYTGQRTTVLGIGRRLSVTPIPNFNPFPLSISESESLCEVSQINGRAGEAVPELRLLRRWVVNCSWGLGRIAVGVGVLQWKGHIGHVPVSS